MTGYNYISSELEMIQFFWW